MILMFSFVSNAFAYTEPKVFIDNQQINVTKPHIINNRTMVEFRPIFEHLGLQVTWDSKNRQVIGEKKGFKIIMTIGNKSAMLITPHPLEATREEVITLDVPAQIVNGRTIVPVRFIAEVTGTKVNWDNQNKVVNIINPPTYCSTPAPKLPLEIAFEDYLKENGFTVKYEDNGETMKFYDDLSDHYSEFYIVRFRPFPTSNTLFLGLPKVERYQELAAEIAIRNGFPSTKEDLLQRFNGGQVVYDGKCNGVTFTYRYGYFGEINLSWK